MGLEYHPDDLQNQNLCMLVKDGLEYKFVHRSFQEYFAAMYTKLLSDDEQKKLLPAFIKKLPSIVSYEYFPILIKLIDAGTINSSVAKEVFEKIFKDDIIL